MTSLDVQLGDINTELPAASIYHIAETLCQPNDVLFLLSVKPILKLELLIYLFIFFCHVLRTRINFCFIKSYVPNKPCCSLCLESRPVSPTMSKTDKHHSYLYLC